MMLAFLFLFINGINFSFATKQRAGQIEFHRTVTSRSDRSYDGSFDGTAIIETLSLPFALVKLQLGQVTLTPRFNLIDANSGKIVSVSTWVS